MRRTLFNVGIGLLASTMAASAQAPTADDAVLRTIWQKGMEESRLPELAQTLLDSIGPRLTGTPGQKSAHDWAVGKYREWGIEARNEQYGTWRGWRRGITHIDLLEPRVRTLEGTMLAWSPGTQGPVSAGTVILPEAGSPQDFERWLPQVAGKLVLISYAQPTCRPDENWEKWATPESFQAMRQARQREEQAWERRLAGTGLNPVDLVRRLEQAGAVGIISSRWSLAWGVNKVFNARTQRVPTLDLSCEDYGLVFRLTASGDAPVLRVNAEAEFLGEVPTFNTVAVIPGRELPNEYVVLSAHFDSWDAASGGTDNGTGTITMMEAMRILREAYPNPKRTILVGHWSGEEQGLNGSRAFAADHPEVVNGLQVLLNQDNGTGRVASIMMQGFTRADASFTRWLAKVPEQITRHVKLESPGVPGSGGSDYASFVCYGAPAFGLSSLSWDYGTYTWHTNRDTYDKLVFDDLRNNATLTAMLAYLASEDPERVSRDRRTDLADARNGQRVQWPACTPPARNWDQSPRVR